MSNPVFQDQRGLLFFALLCCVIHILTVLLSSLDSSMQNPHFCIRNRPHDRVALKEMKVDWHACLDNKVGFKVSCKV